jgi:LacI family transcriptional regulator
MVTMTDIAHKAGVSRATVSLVLNEKHAAVGIAEETRQRVLRAAADLGYRPNELARAMVTGRNPVFGYLLRTPEREVPTRILVGALHEAEKYGHSIKVMPFDGEFDHRIIERCAEMRLAGVLALYIYGAALDYLHEEAGRYSIPVAVVDSSFPAARGIRVVSDDSDGCRQAIQHLTDLGHRRIGFVSGARTSGSANERVRGYGKALREAGISVPDDYLVYGNWEITTIESVTHTILTHPAGRPTALFCADDRTAAIVARTARQRGLSVPRDLSVVGFANLELADYSDPPLTTVAQPFREMGAAAVRHLLSVGSDYPRSSESLPDPVEVLLPTQLIVRASTAPYPPSASSQPMP